MVYVTPVTIRTLTNGIENAYNRRLVEAFVEELRANGCKESTVSALATHLGAWAELLGEKKFEDATREDVRRFITQREGTRRWVNGPTITKKPIVIADATLKQRKVIVRGFHGWLRGGTKRDPYPPEVAWLAPNRRARKADRLLNEILRREDLVRLIEAQDHPQDRDARAAARAVGGAGAGAAEAAECCSTRGVGPRGPGGADGATPRVSACLFPTDAGSFRGVSAWMRIRSGRVPTGSSSRRRAPGRHRRFRSEPAISRTPWTTAGRCRTFVGLLAQRSSSPSTTLRLRNAPVRKAGVARCGGSAFSHACVHCDAASITAAVRDARTHDASADTHRPLLREPREFGVFLYARENLCAYVCVDVYGGSVAGTLPHKDAITEHRIHGGLYLCEHMGGKAADNVVDQHVALAETAVAPQFGADLRLGRVQGAHGGDMGRGFIRYGVAYGLRRCNVTFTDDWGDLPRNRLLDFLADHIGVDYSITELADKAGISRPTVYTVLGELQTRGLVRQTRTLGTSRLFALNTDNPLVQGVLTKDFSAAAEEAPDTKPRRAATKKA